MKDFSKLKISLEGQLIGRKMWRALRAMNIAKQYHINKRKDGSPEFQHQVEICLMLITLPDISDEVLEELIVIGFCHDLLEDYGITINDIAEAPDFNFGIQTANRVYGLSKIYRGVKKDTKEVFDKMAKCPFISLVKGVDRTHNHGTMTGAFTIEKILAYLNETEEYILPMLKIARKSFPRQAKAYYLIETILHRDIHMLRTLMTRMTPI